MILGVGSDLVDIRRIEKTLGRWGEKFIERCFTETEKQRSEGRRGRAASYAKRYAAKEACAKALGTGFRGGVWHKDMGVVNLPGGRPTMALTGGAARRLAELVPAGMTARIDVSITDEPPLAQVIVIISAVPNSSP
jgi:holo-[acyl-carrier protein] synthase